MYSQRRKSSRFNYSLVIRTLLPLVCGPLRYHANMINAAAGCLEFDTDDSRYIAMNGTRNSTYLSNMKLERRNVPEAIQLLFCTGEYDDEFYEKPNAKLFAKIVNETLNFKHEGDDLIFRETIKDVLIDGNNSHIPENTVSRLLYSADNDEIEIFIFNCIYAAIMCGCNSTSRKVYKTEFDEIEADTIYSVDNMTEAEKTVYRNYANEAEDT